MYVRTQTDEIKRITLLRIRAQGNYANQHALLHAQVKHEDE